MHYYHIIIRFCYSIRKLLSHKLYSQITEIIFKNIDCVIKTRTVEPRRRNKDTAEHIDILYQNIIFK